MENFIFCALYILAGMKEEWRINYTVKPFKIIKKTGKKVFCQKYRSVVTGVLTDYTQK